MELILVKTTGSEVHVTCDGQFSHTFSLPVLLDDPVEMGQRLFAALFAEGTPARAAWDARPKRILLVTEDPELDALPWEYLHGPDGFAVLDVAFVRGLPASKCQPPPDLSGTPLHIFAIPSNPIDHNIARLDIEGEWTRLTDGLRGIETAICLERVRPPTMEQARRLTANQRNRVVHFMGHGGHAGAESRLVFEKENGAPDPVSARDFIRRIEDSAFLVTLNACSSAQAGPTGFANLARALAERGVPYTLGMRAPIPDEDAKAFSQTFYGELARGSSVENALRQARNTLVESQNPWAVGIPVLYTSLEALPGGFVTPAGTPRIDEHQPPSELAALPRAEGAFQGRVDELLQLGAYLTTHEKVVTIHGPGGQGKTALAREAAERFAHAWPGGMWAVSLEHASALERFTLELARLLKIDLDGVYKQMAAAHPNQETDVFQGYVQQELERRICHILNRERALLVLDNAETFMQAIEAKEKSALDLAAFLKEKVLSTQAGLLVTSREHLGWTGEKAIELGGLLPADGARLFWQSAPGRGKQAIGPLAQEISRKVEGHPLSLRLLGGAFDASGVALEAFVLEVESTLLGAEDKYKHEDHRHRTLFASIETSVRYLDDDTREFLGSLWIFQSPFVPEIAAQVLESPASSDVEATMQQGQGAQPLYVLWQRGLVVCEVASLSDGSWLFYRTLPIMRLFLHSWMEQTQSAEALQARLGKVYAVLLRTICDQINVKDWASVLALQCREDLEVCVAWIERGQQARYMNHLGWVLQRLGDRRTGQRWLELGLENAQGVDVEMELQITSNIADIYRATGQPNKALGLYKQGIQLAQKSHDRAGEANTLNNMALVYYAISQQDKALELYEQVLSILQEVNDQATEAAALNNMAAAYSAIGQLDEALKLYERSLLLMRRRGDRAGEASALSNMAGIYSSTGYPTKALELYEQALFTQHQLGDRASEAAILNNMALVYGATGHFENALTFYERALIIAREVGDRAGEAATLNNMTDVYRDMGQPGKALEVCEQALPIRREVGDRAGEATTLSNMGMTYYVAGEPDKAMDLYEQALPLMREVGDVMSEASTLNNIAVVYYARGQADKALERYEQALLIRREVHDRAGEANTLNNMALLHGDMEQPDKALEMSQQALALMREVGDQSGEATTLSNLAMLAGKLGRAQQAVDFLRQAVLLEKQIQHPDYLQDAAVLAQWEIDLGASTQQMAQDE